MGRALLSAFLHDLLDNLFLLTPGTKPFIMKPPRYQRKLITILRKLDALVDDAEEKQFTRKSQTVKDWLNSLQYAVYSLKELLCNWTTLEYLDNFGVFSGSNKPNTIVEAQILDIMDSLEDLLKVKDDLGLTERYTWRETLYSLPSVVLDNLSPNYNFYGREEEMNSMLEILLSASEHIKVINIEGMAGVGKTDFVALLYFNHKVRESFEIRTWITVPYRVSLNLLATKILEAVTGEFVPVKDFNELSKKLKESFEGKKFLLVLDDIRFGDYFSFDYWNMLVACFDAAARGSAIILTTNPHDGLLVVPLRSTTIHTLHLNRLSSDDSWSIFLVHAFGHRDLNEYPELVAVGKEIVHRLGNLPLAAKMIGSLLQDKLHLSEWVEILRSKLLDEDDVNLHIPGFLVLCYLDLPAQLKHCFAYLSLFPKGYEFKMKEVVFLWMAQGILQKSNTKSNDHEIMEDIGDGYFGYLIMRSFLQPFNYGVSFTMPNLVHDLASYVFVESHKHHVSYSRSTQDFPRFFQAFSFPHYDITILPDSIGNFRCLKRLNLSHTALQTLPDSIGSLRHLFELDLSHTSLQTLPDFICDMFNLQVLMLTSCTSLTSLPKKFPFPLKELRLSGCDHLVAKVSSTNKEFWLGTELTILHLSRPVSHQIEDDIPSIKEQTDPQSPLANNTLDTTTTHAREETSSTYDLDDERSSFEILKVTTVSQLKLLPPNLHSLKIEGCKSLEVLPIDLLGGLPVLQELYLISCSSLKSFPYPASLTTLYIRNCERLEFPPSLDSRENLACLQHLFIGNSCDSLTTLTLNLFPELKILCIWNCPNPLSFDATHDLALPLESLEIRDCPGLKCFPDEGLNIPNLESMFISNSKSLNKLPNSMNSLTSLKSLFLHRCPLIESFPPGGLPSSLTLLSIAFCDKLTPQKDWLLANLESLTHFEVEGGCIGMESFPDEMLLPRNIISLRISTLKSLKKLDYKGFQHLSSLQTLEINCCDVLKSLPQQGLPSSLDYLCIQECPMLTPRLKPKIGKDWHKVAHIPHVQIEGQVFS